MFQRLREDINSVFVRDPAARNFFEVLTNYPGLHALLMHRCHHWLWNKRARWLARTLSTFARFLTGIEIHPGATIGRRFFIDHGMGVVIGETALIGDDVTLYHGVTLGGTSWHKGKRHPTLGDGVIIGAGAKILGPLTLEAGVKVGSNAVVTKDVPEGATVVGIPGKIVKSAEQDSEQSLDVDPDRREAMRQKFGFDAYGVSQDMPDPVARSMQAMLDHMHAVDERVEQMCSTLSRLDTSYRNGDLPELHNEDFAAVLGEAAVNCADHAAGENQRHDDNPADDKPDHDEADTRDGKG